MSDPLSVDSLGAQAKPTLYLHIGHPKTGSSAFQAFLARHSSRLPEFGLFYPHHDSLKAAARGHVTSGNLPLGPLSENWLLGQVFPVVQESYGYEQALLFSNENLLHRMPEFFDAVDAVMPYCQPHVLLSVRNPLDQLASVYQQLVKRHGFTDDYHAFLAQYHYRCNALHKSAQIVERLEQAGIKYTLFNYSFLGREIVPALARCVGLPDCFLVSQRGDATDGSVVNRSLSASELQLILSVNAIHGRDVGRQLADALVNQLPDVPSTKLTMDLISRQRVEEANRSPVEVLNARLPAETPLSFAALPAEPVSFHCSLSTEQLELCREVLSRENLPHHQRSSRLKSQLSDRILRLLHRLISQDPRFPRSAPYDSRG